MDSSVLIAPNRPETVTPVKRERAVFTATEPRRDDGLRQIEPDAALRQWAERVEQRR